MRLLDRYVFRNFFVPFIYCFCGFIAIWLVFDLSDNGSDFIQARVPVRKVAWFYLNQFPAITLICLPIALLLALLYSLSRMSRSNEIISMLGAGISVVRLLFPLAIAGFAATALSLALSYELVPHAEAKKKAMLQQIVKKTEKRPEFDGQVFRDRTTARTWFVQRTRKNPDELLGVLVIAQDRNGNVLEKHYARRATYDPATSTWTFERGKVSSMDLEGNLVDDKYFQTLKATGWTETPWRIASSNIEPQNLSVSELEDYVRFNADFPVAQLAPYHTQLQNRWALPWNCFVVVLIGAPLGIVFSRRGVLAGVASSLFIFFALIFLTNLFLALGKGARVPAGLAAWGPNAVFGLIGLWLLWLRSNNRELPRLRTIFKRKPYA
ncbi:MAG: LptF/LptG family permease [Verrucomicrobiota bacterium]|nr:LptF/LptG family permease [Verrucomicrobiota bacterium]